MQEQGENLLDKAFEQVTDEQLSAYHLKTDKQWMNNFQIASKTDQPRYAEDFAPCIKGHAGHYVDRIKRKKTSHIWNALAARWMRLLGGTVAEQVASLSQVEGAVRENDRMRRDFVMELNLDRTCTF